MNVKLGSDGLVTIIEGVEEVSVHLEHVPELVARLRAVVGPPDPRPTDSEVMAWGVAARHADEVIRLRTLIHRFAELAPAATLGQLRIGAQLLASEADAAGAPDPG